MGKYLLAGLAVSLLLGGALFAFLAPWQCRVTQANCDRIKKEMTQAEVHAILGAPGDYRTLPPAPVDFWSSFHTGPLRLIEEWEGDEGKVRVDYYSPKWSDPRPERVMLASFQPAKPHNPGPVALATWRLKRLKERWLP
jgi:hypothetical protein